MMSLAAVGCIKVRTVSAFVQRALRHYSSNLISLLSALNPLASLSISLEYHQASYPTRSCSCKLLRPYLLTIDKRNTWLRFTWIQSVVLLSPSAHDEYVGALCIAIQAAASIKRLQPIQHRSRILILRRKKTYLIACTMSVLACALQCAAHRNSALP